MKDDSTPLSSYHLKPGCTITVMGTAEQLDEASGPSSNKTGGGKVPAVPAFGKKHVAPTTQQGTLQAIQAELEAVRASLKPSVVTFLSLILPSTQSTPPEATPTSPAITASPSIPQSQPTPQKAREEHTRLGELLLQALLRLDAILPESEWTDARSARKTAVKEVQSLLDELDEGWRSSSLSHPTR